MERGLRGQAGQPNLPYAEFETYAGSDVWLALVFLDRAGTPASPTTLSYRIDNLNVGQVVQGDTPIILSAGATSYELNIPASINAISCNWQSSQLFQVTVTATYSDGSQNKKVFIYELIGINTTGGQ